jgi:hypothetical protein
MRVGRAMPSYSGNTTGGVNLELGVRIEKCEGGKQKGLGGTNQSGTLTLIVRTSCYRSVYCDLEDDRQSCNTSGGGMLCARVVSFRLLGLEGQPPEL